MIVAIESALNLFNAERTMALLGLVMLCGFIWLLVRANRKPNSKVDLDYLWLDATTGTITAPKFFGMGAFIASTYWVTYTLITDDFNETIFGWYLVAWSGSATIAFVMQRFGKQPPGPLEPDPPFRTKETTTVEKEVSVPTNGKPPSAIKTMKS